MTQTGMSFVFIMLKSTTALSLDTLTENYFFKKKQNNQADNEINLNHVVHIKKRF